MKKLCLLALPFFLFSCPQPGEGDEAAPPLAISKNSIPCGINLAGIADWSEEIPFKDFVKIARPWNNERSAGLSLDENGWVTSLGTEPSAEIAWDAPISDPGGDFVCLYDGEGDIEVDSPYHFIKVRSESPGRIEFTIDEELRRRGGRGFWSVAIRRTDPADHIRNIRVVKKEYESNYLSDPWNPDFIARVVDRFNTLRFMDWQATNGSPTAEWHEMKPKDYYTQTSCDTGKSTSVSIEWMVDLCNRTGSNGWFCIPHKASDDYVRRFAAYLRDHMDPDLKVYVEYSNECWNWQFGQTDYCHLQGVAQNLDPDEWTAWRAFYAKRSVEIFHIFESAFAGRTDALVRVLASQGAYYDMTGRVLNYVYPDGTGKTAATHADVLAIAPYFGGDAHSQAGSGGWGLDELFAFLSHQVNDAGAPGEGDTVRRWMIDNVEYFIKPNPNLRLVAYEGGQHLLPLRNVGTEESPLWQLDQGKLELYRQAQADPRMKALYKQYLTRWREAGGHLFMAFSSVGNWGQYGYWGILPDYPARSSAKYAGILEWINENPAWWD
jgi:hypothetical protein